MMSPRGAAPTTSFVSSYDRPRSTMATYLEAGLGQTVANGVPSRATPNHDVVKDLFIAQGPTRTSALVSAQDQGRNQEGIEDKRKAESKRNAC